MNPDRLDPGTELGDYRIEARLGSGGMGVVYKAREIGRDRVVALKVITADRTSPAGLERFRRAAQAARRLDHPNIATTLAVGETDGLHYLAMEYIDGASLHQAVPHLAAAPAGILLRWPAIGSHPEGGVVVQARPGPPTADPPTLDLGMLAVDGPPAGATSDPASIPTGDLPGAVGPGPALSVAAAMLILEPGYHRLCCAWVRDAARGVHHAHQQGIIHRDVKPGNLMLARDGRVRVIDFGLARGADDLTLTASGQLLGSPLYMSPEQVTGRIELTGRTDVYSLGLVLYELLTLGPPIPAADRQELFQRIIARPLDPVAAVNPAVGPAVAAVVHQATAKDPADRYATAGELADDLDRAIAGRPVAARTYRTPVRGTEALALRPVAVAALSVQLFVGAAIWLGYGYFLSSLTDVKRGNLAANGIPAPFLSWGDAGPVAAVAVAALLVAGSVWVSNGFRRGYGVGWAGLAVLAASSVAAVAVLRALAAFNGTSALSGTIGGLVLLGQLAWQAVVYGRRPVRAWFDAVQQARRVDPLEGAFRGRPVGDRPVPTTAGPAGPTAAPD